MKRILIAVNLIALPTLVHSREPIFIGTDSNSKLTDVAIVFIGHATEPNTRKAPKLFVYDILESKDPKLKETLFSAPVRNTEFSLAPFFVLKPGSYKIRGYCKYTLRDTYVDLVFDAEQNSRILLRCLGKTPNTAKLDLAKTE